MGHRRRDAGALNSENVSFDSDGCRLAGTFAPVADPVAAALLLPGSGRVDRDSNLRWLRLDLTRILAETLAPLGVSTLRYDKRGVGASAGDYLSTGFGRRRDDARAAVDWLANRLPGVPLLVVGHSEGGMHAIELAADGTVAGAVLLSAAARPGEQVLQWQAAALLSTLPGWLTAGLRLARIDSPAGQRKRLDRIRRSGADVQRMRGVRVNARWLREFAAYDPAPALRRITVPVLAITGGHDLQVPPEDVEVMGRLVRGPFDGRVVGDLGHLLRPDPDRLGMRDYRRAVRRPIAPAVLDSIADWVAAHWPSTGRRACAGD
ncbi:alpha/beta hydrolase [Nocardia sp. alder85J]|uniref:alpha/beta hydrolase n=1 Tax=Nocardia sp. alder85J TaxID=2862949 RepID=UPI001CD424DB|nr:alpha/beta fold hydrolase [Nocardia sp. alder85J]MCX4094378.1 alpha/beta fold hydrolase [Nocardia sp. alder85J]